MSFSGCKKEQAKVVKIDSDPQGAIVFIDNDDPVETPVEYKLTFGSHYMTFRKAGYYDVVKKDVEVNKDTTLISATLSISATLEPMPTAEEIEEMNAIGFNVLGPIVFSTVPYLTCCSAAAIAYSNIFYGGTYTVSGATTLDSFDIIFPGGKTVHFDTEKVPNYVRIRKFSKVVTFDEIGSYEIISNGEHEYSFGVDYKAKILPPTPKLKDLLPNSDYKNAIAVPLEKEVEARLLITDAKGNPIRNTSLGVYNLKTDKDGIVTFKAKVDYRFKIFVNDKPADVRIYSDVLVWAYQSAKFTKDGHLIESSIPEIKEDIKVILQNNDVYISCDSFEFDIQTWYQLDYSGKNKEIINLPKDPSLIYTNTFISKDSGLHWDTPGFVFDAIAVDPDKPNVVYGYSCLNPYGIAALFKSEDFGTHFAKIEDIEFVKQIVVDPRDSNIIYLATYKGLFRSDDGGKTWDHSCDPRRGDVEFVAVSPENSNIVFLSTGGGFFKSEDRCKTWKKISLVKSDSQEGTVNCIVFDPVSTNTIYAGTEKALFVSKDAGENWEKLGAFSICGDESIAVDPTNPNKIYIYSYGKGIYKSQDYGKHFTKINFPFNLKDAGITVDSAGKLLVNAGGIPFKLDKNGNFAPLGSNTFFKNGPKWKIIDGKFYIVVNTINSYWIRGIVTDKAIEFYETCDTIP